MRPCLDLACFSVLTIVHSNTLQNFGCYDTSRDISTDLIKWQSQTPHELLLERIASFDKGVQDILKYVDPNNMYLWRILHRKPLPAFQKGRLVLVGDACHRESYSPRSQRLPLLFRC